MFDTIFRLNPLFTLTCLQDVDEKQKEQFTRFASKKDFFGLLHAPPEAKLTVKAVNRDLAVFLQQLHEPKRLSTVFSSLGEKAKEEDERYILRLVLDNVLEVQHEGEFISGVEAVNRVLSPPSRFQHPTQTPGKRNRIQILSDASIFFAVNSALVHPRDVSLVLYNFNRIPLSRHWKQRFPNETALATYLDLSDDGSWEGMSNWAIPRVAEKETNGKTAQFDLYWRGWNFARKRPPEDMPSYKVYFSPLPQDLPDVFRIVRHAASHSEAHFMKIGRNVPEILRADKLIVYFGEYRHAVGFAREMSGSLASFRYQGTPFSYQVNPDNPLVSIGVDPPRNFGNLFSWRLYITTKLSLAIQGARRTGAKDISEYIHTYMRVVGVDSLNWCPLNEDWSIAFRVEEKKDGQSE